MWSPKVLLLLLPNASLSSSLSCVATTVATEPYTLTADDKGNAYLYGIFAEGATVTVKQGDAEAGSHTFTTATVAGMSYALNATVAKATEEDNIFSLRPSCLRSE